MKIHQNLTLSQLMQIEIKNNVLESLDSEDRSDISIKSVISKNKLMKNPVEIQNMQNIKTKFFVKQNQLLDIIQYVHIHSKPP